MAGWHHWLDGGEFEWTPGVGDGQGGLACCDLRVRQDWVTELNWPEKAIRLQQCVNWELPDVQAGFRKGRGTRDQIANIRWIIEKAREFYKNIYFCFIDYTKAFNCVDHNKLWKILTGWEYQTTLPASWEICVQAKKQQLEPNKKQWFQIRKEVHQGCILSPCLFNLYAEYIMWNARLDESQAGIKTAGRNINNLSLQMIPQ